ncbi:GGDEF domain-containing protein [Maledivibacter halophilus]|uniref:Diguanylate cyclase (GGDEF) domain-containing protein n=1 Tax=Maledivibacter halophilus TaxID=36842 RepID=A0A1T5IA86_9FIRM|nr:GGDEF domain-containing protein [Maledivibacter halophilus]SKC36095.1 diguanylate cyclase (GGDEF) domain-containing protein [Maledivibacter halophilus]
MFDLIYKSLDMVNIGVIVIDEDYNILIWNFIIEKISKISKNYAINKKLCQVCPTFSQKKYKDIINQSLIHGQSRFCSGILHKAFVYPSNGKQNTEPIRQNMIVAPIYIKDNKYALIQIMDITNLLDNELKLKTVIKDLESAYVDVKASEANTKRIAYIDSLTGLSNRLSFHNELSNSILSTNINKYMLGILFLDLDGFKEVNDTFGHASGDDVLKEVANRLKSNLRTIDVIARRSGDEFTVILKNIKFERDIAAIAKKLIYEIGRPYFLDNGVANISVSIGISVWSKDGNDAEELISKADEAMYHVKKTTKNWFHFYEE